MFRKSLTLTTLAILLFTFRGSGQDPEFSQFYANPLYLNPALAGATTCPHLVLNYRNQWPELSNSFVTYNLSYDQYVDKIHGGVGLLVNADNAGGGILRTTTASLMYSFRLQAGENFFINMAVQGSFYQKALNWDKLQFEDEIDPQLGFIDNTTSEQPPDNSSVMFPDFDAGAAFGWKGILYGGVAVHHLTRPDMAFYSSNTNKLPMKFTGHLGMNINLEGGGELVGDGEPTFYLAPNVVYQQQGPFHQINAGLYVIRYPLIVGGWFRHNFENADAVIALIGIQYESLKVGYSYDMTLSKLKSNTGGAHEVSIAWQFSCYEKRRKIKAINAPGF